MHHAQPACGGPNSRRRSNRRGFTVIELLGVMTVIGILATLGLPRLRQVVEQARVARAIGDIRGIQADLMALEAGNQPLPASLAAIGHAGTLDPWGRPYQYNRFPVGGHGVPPGARRDRFLVPINSTFDLYSLGKDGASVAPLTANPSRDDIVRANDGGFIGRADKY